mgnify:CR=1 FL=1
MLFRQAPDLANLRVIRFLCYPLDLNQTSTFGTKARRCLFIGYSQGQKAYKMYDLETHKTFVNGDVKFMKHIFPYKHSSSQTSSPETRLFPIVQLTPEDDMVGDISQAIYNDRANDNLSQASQP